MKNLNIVILFFSLLVINGCNNYDNKSLIEMHEDYRQVMSYSNDVYKEQFNFFTVFDSYKTSALEIENGIYLGAYILDSLYYDIQSFEDLVQRPHAIYANNMELGSTFPENWLLECISHMKTPYITLSHGNLNNPFNLMYVTDLAIELGKFRVPIFLDFFPNQRQHNYNPEEYIKFFRDSREIFSYYAPNVIFVWSINEDDVLDSDIFYPGNDYVDWVGISIFKSIVENGNPFEKNTFNRLDAFYHTYQVDKPIIISKLGISHFSTINHIYHPQLAGEQIKYFYETILNQYPRVKGIIYMDINTIDNPTTKYNKDNFSITTNLTVLDFYSKVIINNKFIDNLDFNLDSTIVPQLIKSPFNVYRINHNFYISDNILIYDLGINDLSYYDDYKVKINGSPYYNLSILNYYKIYNVTIDNDLRQIIIS